MVLNTKKSLKNLLEQSMKSNNKQIKIEKNDGGHFGQSIPIQTIKENRYGL